MSAHTKKPPTSSTNAHFVWNGAHYSVPIKLIEQYKLTDNASSNASVESLFGDVLSNNDEPGVLLKGLRLKEGLTQIQFAQHIEITQANLSAMENGRRSIGKDIAKRIHKRFGMNYRLFL